MDLNLLPHTCPNCSREMAQGQAPWHFICADCAYEKSTLHPAINSGAQHTLIDESSRKSALQDVRVSNFQKIIGNLLALRPQGGRLLEVGCAHGWFLGLASKYFAVMGLEPDRDIYQSSNYQGNPVRMGYFPEALGADEMFDVIVFNDVLEHIPDIQKTIIDCKAHLNQGGLLVINLPSSQGIFYRLSKWLVKLGFPGAFKRMWQVGLPSPHLHYLNAKNIASLLECNGLLVKLHQSLPTLSLRGLWGRLTYTGENHPIMSAAMFLAIVAGYPALRLLPADIIYVVAERK